MGRGRHLSDPPGSTAPAQGRWSFPDSAAGQGEAGGTGSVRSPWRRNSTMLLSRTLRATCSGGGIQVRQPQLHHTQCRMYTCFSKELKEWTYLYSIPEQRKVLTSPYSTWTWGGGVSPHSPEGLQTSHCPNRSGASPGTPFPTPQSGQRLSSSPLRPPWVAQHPHTVGAQQVIWYVEGKSDSEAEIEGRFS